MMAGMAWETIVSLPLPYSPYSRCLFFSSSLPVFYRSLFLFLSSHSLTVSLSLSLSLILSFSQSRFLSLLPSFVLCINIITFSSVSLSLSLSFSVTFSASMYLFVWLPLCVSLSLCHSVSFPRSPLLTFCISLLFLSSCLSFFLITSSSTCSFCCTLSLFPCPPFPSLCPSFPLHLSACFKQLPPLSESGGSFPFLCSFFLLLFSCSPFIYLFVFVCCSPSHD